MHVLLQQWKQLGNPDVLTSISYDKRGWRQARRVLLFAEEKRTIPEGDVMVVELADFAPCMKRLTTENFMFLSDAEVTLYISFLPPS